MFVQPWLFPFCNYLFVFAFFLHSGCTEMLCRGATDTLSESDQCTSLERVLISRSAHNAGRPCRDTHNAGMGIHNADPPLPIKPESFSAHNADTREPYNAGPTAMRISQRGQPYNAGLPTQSYISAEDTCHANVRLYLCAQPLQSTKLEFPRRLKYTIIKPSNRILNGSKVIK